MNTRIKHRNIVMRSEDVVRVSSFRGSSGDSSEACHLLNVIQPVPSGRNQPLGFPSSVLSTDVKMNSTEPGISETWWRCGKMTTGDRPYFPRPWRIRIYTALGESH